DHRGVRARLGDRARDRVEDRDALEVGAAPARGHARDHLRAVLAAEARVQLAGGAGDALGEDARPAVDEHAHRYTLIGILRSRSWTPPRGRDCLPRAVEHVAGGDDVEPGAREDRLALV